MSEKVCESCKRPSKAWYGVLLENGKHGALCEGCYRADKEQYEAWLAGLGEAEKLAHGDELLRRAGILSAQSSSAFP